MLSETQGRVSWNFLDPEKKALNHVPEFALVLTVILHPGFSHWGVFLRRSWLFMMGLAVLPWAETLVCILGLSSW